MVAGNAWRINGIRQLQSEARRCVPRVIAAAGIAPPFQPVLYKDVKRPLANEMFRSVKTLGTLYEMLAPPLRRRNLDRISRRADRGKSDAKSEDEAPADELTSEVLNQNIW